jgi:hypothetical protein
MEDVIHLEEDAAIPLDELGTTAYANEVDISNFLSDESEYDLNLGTPIDILEIEVSTRKIPRYSCAAHKCNIAVRKSVKQEEEVSDTLVDLSQHASNTRKSIKLSEIHYKTKSRLRTDNKTRWSSSFLMLNSFLKAYKNKAFEGNLTDLYISI